MAELSHDTADQPKPTLDDRCIAAGLTLSAECAWARISLVDVAEAAGAPPSQAYAAFGSTVDLAAGIWLRLDAAAVDSAAQALDPALTARERAFEAAMARFDLMEETRPAYASLLRFARRSTVDRARRLRALARPARWLLDAAQIGREGGPSRLGAAVFAGVLHRAEAAWLEDEDGAQSRTLARLDRDLADLETFGGQLRRVGARFGRRAAANDRG
ncbi:MAG: hypothetical protein ACFB2Z_01790 [Maricaulaceae bacterium]